MKTIAIRLIGELLENPLISGSGAKISIIDREAQFSDDVPFPQVIKISVEDPVITVNHVQFLLAMLVVNQNLQLLADQNDGMCGPFTCANNHS